MRNRRTLFLLAPVVLAVACDHDAIPSMGAADGVARWSPEIVGRLPHDPEAWTQGLVVDGDAIFESTGRYGYSTLRELDRSTGALRRGIELTSDLYGEGLALADGGGLIQLTWQEETLLVWDRATLTEVRRIGYSGEGWGLCVDGDRLVMSDGSATLAFRDPATFEVSGTVRVRLDAEPLSGLNELECVDGLVFANVWPTSEIAVVDLESGAVTAMIDGSGLEGELGEAPDADVLNGIAYDPRTDTFLLTGKLWSTLFEVRFVSER